MKTLLVYNNTGKVICTMSGSNIEDDYICSVKETEENKTILSVDVSTGDIIYEDTDSTERIEAINEYLSNSDDSTISRVEDTILEVESNKISEENGGM